MIFTVVFSVVYNHLKWVTVFPRLFVFLQSEQVAFHRVCHVALLADIHIFHCPLLVSSGRHNSHVFLTIMKVCHTFSSHNLFPGTVQHVVCCTGAPHPQWAQGGKNINKLREKNSPFLCWVLKARDCKICICVFSLSIIGVVPRQPP